MAVAAFRLKTLFIVAIGLFNYFTVLDSEFEKNIDKLVSAAVCFRRKPVELIDDLIFDTDREGFITVIAFKVVLLGYL